MMGSGLMIKLTDTVCISMLMEHSMKESGKMIFNTAKELKLGLMGLDMRETMHSEESMELDHISGMMDHNILEIGMKTRLVVLVFILGLMAVNMKENGRITTWKV